MCENSEKTIITGYLDEDGELVVHPESNKVLYWVEQNGKYFFKI